jgi:formyl-CoA transferase
MKPSVMLPLDGIRVFDLSQVGLGPWATQMLGDFGADVIKLEVPGRGDLSRTFDPFLTESNGQSAYFMASNRNKRSITIDLQQTDGRQLAKRLAVQADVVVHNFRPGVAERLGLGYEALKEANPRLVYAWGSGFGSGGPLVDRPGQDFLAQSLSGVISRNRDLDGTPRILPTTIADYAGALLIGQGVFLALYHRERTGEGQSVYVSLLDALLSMQQMEAVQFMLREKETDWVRNSLIGVVRTSDGALTLAGVFRPNPLADICRALEVEDLSLRPEYSTLAVQRENKPTLWPLIEAAVEKLTTEEAVRRFESNNVLCSAVFGLREALQHPQLIHNKSIVSFEDPVHGTVRAIGSPLKLSAASELPARTPPRLGQHTDEILAELGLSDREIADLKLAGTLG